jgi:hypothetical protein
LLLVGPRGHHIWFPILPGRKVPHALHSFHGCLPAAQEPSLLGKSKRVEG